MSSIEELARKFQAGEKLEMYEKYSLVSNKHQLPEPVQNQLMQQLEAEVSGQPDGEPELSKSQRKRIQRKIRLQQWE
jgi:hypothetical protein